MNYEKQAAANFEEQTHKTVDQTVPDTGRNGEHTEAEIQFEREMREFLQSLINKGVGDCDDEDDEGETPC